MRALPQPPQDHRSGREIQRDDDRASYAESHPSSLEQCLSAKFTREIAIPAMIAAGVCVECGNLTVYRDHVCLSCWNAAHD